jgi:hypothetical protein
MDDAQTGECRHYTYGDVPLLINLFLRIAPLVGNAA